MKSAGINTLVKDSRQQEFELGQTRSTPQNKVGLKTQSSLSARVARLELTSEALANLVIEMLESGELDATELAERLSLARAPRKVSK